jgi:WASH complex subunit 7
MYYCSEAVKFLPEMDDIISFEKWAGSTGGGEGGGEKVSGANLSQETQRAAKNMDEVISTLVKNFGEGSDYFKVLVNVFQSVLLTAEHDHLRTFYMIVPSLCISWLDASLQAKEAVYKVVRGPTKEMYFTDDGFAMGVAYCLAILKQTRKNEALHWVDTVRQKHRVDLKAQEEQQARRAKKEAEIKERKEREEKAKRGILNFFKKKKEGEEEEEDHEDMEEVHTLQLTAKRLEAQRRETDQLFYSMTGAGIFFKRTDVET